MSLYCMHLPILPNVPSCLHHLIPEECVEAFYVHTYIWHCSPPDLEWAAHEVLKVSGAAACFDLGSGLRKQRV
jgi:hypothetical protein